ncbi:hypothetical protein [Halalkalibaculum sp. DA384]|uniref:hypothetical protein n=1 Tax=Halalkalibaculum sp. DA384 TaxID=3373606 RepID=UPI003754C17D
MFLSKMKNKVACNVKNLVGWRTRRKIVVFSVDDYGNVRLDSRQARERMEQEGLQVLSPFKGFDLYDSLENRGDLEMLYEVLTSVKDKNGNHAIFTPFAVPCNINFEKVRETGYKEYHSEMLPETYSKLSAQQPEAYKGAWRLWKEGIRKGLLQPQFHGREHLNLKLFNEKLQKRDEKLLTALKNRSCARISSEEYETVSILAAFDFWDVNENNQFREIIVDGLDAFERVFGYRATHFNPPGGREHSSIHKVLKKNDVHFIDTPMIKREHQGKGTYRTKFNYTGKKNKHGQLFLVRNVVFEPTQNRGVDWVDHALMQIEAAFRWHRPAIISSHRVNFCGHIDEKNRKIGLEALQTLLAGITARWPEAEFMAADELGKLIASK